VSQFAFDAWWAFFIAGAPATMKQQALRHSFLIALADPWTETGGPWWRIGHRRYKIEGGRLVATKD